MSDVHVNDRPNEVRVNPRDMNRVDVVEQPVYVEISMGGPQGTPGASGVLEQDIPALVSYTHTQGAAASTWVVAHNLNFYPNVTVVSSGGAVVEGDIAYPDSNTLTITFTSSFSGVAYLS
jgi:hypothetical protein